MYGNHLVRRAPVRTFGELRCCGIREYRREEAPRARRAVVSDRPSAGGRRLGASLLVLCNCIPCHLLPAVRHVGRDVRQAPLPGKTQDWHDGLTVGGYNDCKIRPNRDVMILFTHVTGITCMSIRERFAYRQILFSRTPRQTLPHLLMFDTLLIQLAGSRCL